MRFERTGKKVRAEKTGETNRGYTHKLLKRNVLLTKAQVLRQPTFPPFPPSPSLSPLLCFLYPGGDLASTGLMKELQRVQVQVPG